MYPWSELKRECDPDTSFAYWLLAEKRKKSPEKYELEDLSSWFSLHYDLEEQSHSKSELKSTGKYNKDFQPVSPITLAKEWTPFDLASEILGQPTFHSKEPGDFHAFTLARYKSRFLGGVFPEAHHSEHESHFIYLLRLVASYSELFTGNIYLMESVGWSYEHEAVNDMLTNPEVSVAMHQAGYLYTERVGARRG